MGTLKQVKFAMRSDAELRPLLVRSQRHELLIDLDGDKVADIALIDNNHDGDIDMIAVDTTGNGDFNLYVGDEDANGIIDTIEYYDDDDEIPAVAYFGRAVEERFIELGDAIYTRIVAGKIIASELIAAFKDLVAAAEEAYAEIQAEEAEKAEKKDE